MRIAASIAQIDNHESLSHFVRPLCRHRAGRAAKNNDNDPSVLSPVDGLMLL